MKRRRFGRQADDTVKVNAKTYVLAKVGGKPVYSTSTRAIEGKLTDDDRIVITDWSGALGNTPYLTDNCIATKKGRLALGPKITYLSGGDLVNLTTMVRHWFEEVDANGNWYLYGVSGQQVVKLELAATPVVRALPLNSANRRFGQPAKAKSSVGGNKYFVPNGETNLTANDLARLTTVGIGAGADTWDEINVDAIGFSHLCSLPNGRTASVTGQYSSGAYIGVSSLRILPAGSNADAAADWGAPFPVGTQAFFAVGLAGHGDSIVTFKQDGAYGAYQRADNTLEFEELTPDARGRAVGTPLDFPFGKGLSWHGRLLIPGKPHLWRWIQSAHYPVGIDSHPDNIGDETPVSNELKYGVMPSVETGSEWVFGPYNKTTGAYIAIGRQARPGESSVTELIWTTFSPFITGRRIESVFPTVNDPFGPRLFWHEFDPQNSANSRIGYCQLGIDYDPYHGNIGPYGAVNSSGFSWSREYYFPNQITLREARFELEGAAAGLSWALDTGQPGDGVKQVGGGATLTGVNTGSIFWTPGLFDRVRFAVRFRPKWSTDGTFNPNNNMTRLRRLVIEFTHRPDKGDAVTFVVDVRKTALRRRVSQKQVRDELRDLRDASTAARPWTDPLGETGYIMIDDTSEDAPEKAAGVLGTEIMTVRGSIQEYS